MEVLGHEYNPDQWRLFSDSSKVSLKVVLLHNGNKFPSVPLAHAANRKESYESMKLLLGIIKYDEFKWKLCGDLKVVALLLGKQLGLTKCCCFLCEWDSWDKKNHYVNKMWPKWTSLTSGEKCIFNPPLVLLEKIYLPPLCIKMGFMKNFVNGMDKTGRGFEYVRNKFPNVSDAKSRSVYLKDPRSGNWCKTKSSMKTWMRLKEEHGCHLRGFARTSYEITKHRNIRMLCRICWLRAKLWYTIWVWKSTFWIPTWIFSQKISAKSVTNTVKDFTKTLWLWKSGTKATGPQVCWQTIAGHWRGMYLKPITGWSHMPLHFRGKFLFH